MTEFPFAIINDVLKATLGSHGFDHADVKAGFDHDGEEALFIDAVLKPNSPLVEGKIYSKALGALSDALLKHGERRFPYLMLHHPDAEAPEPLPWSPQESTPS